MAASGTNLLIKWAWVCVLWLYSLTRPACGQWGGVQTSYHRLLSTDAKSSVWLTHNCETSRSFQNVPSGVLYFTVVRIYVKTDVCLCRFIKRFCITHLSLWGLAQQQRLLKCFSQSFDLNVIGYMNGLAVKKCLGLSLSAIARRKQRLWEGKWFAEPRAKTVRPLSIFKRFQQACLCPVFVVLRAAIRTFQEHSEYLYQHG